MRPFLRWWTPAVCTLAASVALSVVPAPAAADHTAVIGVADHKPETFQEPLFRSLGVKRTRLVTPYDSVFSAPAELDRWIRSAQAGGLEPLVAFSRPSYMRCPAAPCRAPSVAAYTRAFRAFRARYPEVRSISPWNEANNNTEVTARNPRAAALYNNVVRRYCSGCRIVAADVLDIANLRSWMRSFQRYARGNPRLRIWGLHNYGDVNRFRSTGTRTLLRYTSGKIWMTETGGLVTFRAADGRTIFAPSEARATRALSYLLGPLRRLGGRRLDRIYLYNWRPLATGSDRFDAGLVRPDGSPRPTYQVLQRYRGLIR